MPRFPLRRTRSEPVSTSGSRPPGSLTEYQSRHHSMTLPCISDSPHAFGFFCPTRWEGDKGPLVIRVHASATFGHNSLAYQGVSTFCRGVAFNLRCLISWMAPDLFVA